MATFSNSGGGGGQWNGREPTGSEQCMLCLLLVFPRFNLNTYNFLFACILTAVFTLTVFADSATA